ncbi:hypothetical protein, partial [Pseudomonas fluorescens]|uniref:hypothetical protein n=1 Tax=Pseudomonas fluorescens TaxID=294 RepID=UPI001C832F0F
VLPAGKCRGEKGTAHWLSLVPAASLVKLRQNVFCDLFNNLGNRSLATTQMQANVLHTCFTQSLELIDQYRLPQLPRAPTGRGNQPCRRGAPSRRAA